MRRVLRLKICTPPIRGRSVELNLMQVKTPLARMEEFCIVKSISLKTVGP
jgi:hypothetical protein